MGTQSFFQFEIVINISALPDPFEYLCYGSTAIINILLLHINFRRQSLQMADSDVECRSACRKCKPLQL